MKLLLLLLLFVSYAAANNCTKENQVYHCGHQFVCLDGICASCNASEQCSNYPTYICETTGLMETECVHKGLFPGVDRYDVLSTIFCFFGSMIASSSGVGGGGLFVPILLLVGKFTPRLATAISSVIIFGSSISNVLIAIFQKHPEADRPMIDYDVSLLMTPAILAGVMVGVLFNVIFPNWLILTLLLLLLGFTVVRTTQRGIKEFREESRGFKIQKEAQENLTPTESEQKQSILGDHLNSINNDEIQIAQELELKDHPLDDSEIKGSDITEESIYYNDEMAPEDSIEKAKRLDLEVLVKSESRRLPFIPLIVLAFCWIILLISTILKGSQRFPSIIPGLKPCGVWYWLIEALVFPLLMIMTFLAGFTLRRRHTRKIALNYKFLKGDIQWNTKNTLLIPFVCLVAGILAGLLGLGGGMVIGPVFLEMGVLTQVAANTSSFIIFLTVSSTVVQYALIGVLPLDYTLWFIGFGFISSFIGQFIILRIIKKFQRTSFVILLLSFTIAISAILMLTVGIWDLVLDIQNGAYMGFRASC